MKAAKVKQKASSEVDEIRILRWCLRMKKAEEAPALKHIAGE